MRKWTSKVFSDFVSCETIKGEVPTGLNFAAVMEAPVIFLFHKSATMGGAISTPLTEQLQSDCIVKGQAYEIQSTDVDGNDALVVYTAVQHVKWPLLNKDSF
ncbi:putative 2-dehydropantoate 2-reductase [Camellia lanceoleosa]|uniref:2-dehydropantoate 2-reductase n=1 Tax=Camellia lanceoleosa TaxID=1840588 RepID=A0ACC0H5V5_9ERIC|nr:putative 2-dehydropantoate 2-reductase [Camellia lanceoleosa]